MQRYSAYGLDPSAWRPISNGLAISLTLVSISSALRLPQVLGLELYPQQIIAAILALALPLAFLTLPAHRKNQRVLVPLHDCLAALLSFALAGFIALEYQSVVNLIFLSPVATYAPGVLIVLLLLEALRRTTGWPLVLLICGFILYALLGGLAPESLSVRSQDWRILSGYLAFDSNGILGAPLTIASTVVVAFILFGNLLMASGGSAFFTDAALSFMGRFRGGSVKISLLSSGLFGAVSGSAVANVVVTGTLTIPMIKRDGYPAYKAAAIEAVASTGGQLMPPVMGAAAFLMAEYLQVSYTEVVLAAIIPALLYYFAIFVQTDLEAARLDIGQIPSNEKPPRKTVLRGAHFLAAFALLFYALFAWNMPPEQAALIAACSVITTAIVFGYNGDRPELGKLTGTLASTGHAVVEVLLISAAAGLIIGVLNLTGLGFTVTYVLTEFGNGNLFGLLLGAAALCILLGMGLPTLGIYVLLSTLVAPALIKAGVEPPAAHLFVLYFGMMSMITPPIALAVIAAAGIARASNFDASMSAMKLGWVAYIVPFLFVFSPALILVGSPLAVFLAIAKTVIGIGLICIAVAGYLLRRIHGIRRALFAGLGILALLPFEIFEGSFSTNIAGVLGGGILFGWEYYRQSRQNTT